MIKLGAWVRDAVTGFEGVAMGRAEWLFEAPSILIQPQAGNASGRSTWNESRWIAESRVEMTESGSWPTSWSPYGLLRDMQTGYLQTGHPAG